MNNLRAKIILSAILVVIIFLLFPGEEIINRLSATNPIGTALAFVSIFISVSLTSYRFHVLAKRFELIMPISTAHFINIMSQLSGLAMLQTLGQMLSRAGIGSLYIKNAQRMILLTLLEKASSFASLFIIALIGGYTAVQTIHVDFVLAGPILLVLAIQLASIITLLKFGLSPGQKRYLKKAILLIHRLRLEHTIAISTVVHLCTLAAYVIIAHFFLPNESLLTLAAAFSVVMLGAAIPISFAGWGLRELTAGFVFSSISLDPAIGVAVAALVGLLFLASLAVHGLISNLAMKHGKLESRTLAEGHAKIHIERLIAFISGLAIALLIGSQSQVLIGVNKATINLADPFAIVAGLTFIVIWRLWNRDRTIWRVPKMNLGLLFFIVMIIFGWGIGYLTYGSNQWASVNRVFGLVILMSYLFSGAMFTAFFDIQKINSLLKAMVIVSSLAYIVYFLAMTFPILPGDILNSLKWGAGQFSGLSYNRNAYAMQMVMVLSILIASPHYASVRSRDATIGVIIFLILASGSRTAILASCLALALALYLQTLNTRRLLRTVAWVTVLLSGQWLLVTAAQWQSAAASLQHIQVLSTINDLKFDNFQADRIASYIGGAKMWLDNIFFGGGLGAFIDSQKPVPLVVHNTLLWILAEMGIFGLALFLYLPIRLLSHALRNGTKIIAWQDAALVLCMSSAFVFSLFHEISYQRIFWFMIGLLAANYWKISSNNQPAYPLQTN